VAGWGGKGVGGWGGHVSVNGLGWIGSVLNTFYLTPRPGIHLEVFFFIYSWGYLSVSFVAWIPLLLLIYVLCFSLLF